VWLNFSILYRLKKQITKIVLQWDHVPSNVNYCCLTRSQLQQFCGPSCNCFQNTHPLSWEIFHGIFLQIHIWNTAALKTEFNSIAELRHTLVPPKDWDMHLPATNQMIHGASVTTNNWSYTPVWKVWQTLHGCILRYSLCPLHSPDLTPCDFYLWRSLSDKNV